MWGQRKKVIILLSLLFLLFAGGFIFATLRYYQADETEPPAPIVVWSGAGDDTTCAGGVGSGNWWSCSLNWSTGVVPTSADHVVFDSTSIKNATVDTAFLGTVHDISIYNNYTGVITQACDLNVSHDFNQHGATFNSNPSYQFNVGGSFFVADNQVSNGSVNAIRGDSNGNIYIGGSFTAISGLPIKYMAKFDGKQWSKVGDEFDGVVNALTIDSNNSVYAAGNFTKIGNLTVNSIAKWNGSNWSALDGGLTDGYGGTPNAATVKVLALDDQNRLYVGGTFESAGSVGRVNHLARWTGEAWEKFNYGLGSTVTTSGDGNSYLNGYVNQIIIKDNSDPSATDKDIYIGGSFTNICGNDLCTTSNTVGNHLVKFNGSTGVLASLGDMKSAVTSMIFDATDRLTVYSSSGITSTAGSTCSIGYFDGTSWFCHNSYGGSINKFIKINDVVYTGGSNNWPGALTNFNEAIKGAPDYNYYASSVPLGSGLNGTVYDLADISDVLYASGSFTGSIVKYIPTEPTRAKQLASPFSKSVFNRYTGDGSSATPYQISDVYGLQAIVLASNKYYALSCNIDATVTTNWNKGRGLIPLGNLMNSFSGNFNGNSHTINRFTITDFDQYAGLFGYVDKTGILSNLNITDANLSSTESVNNIGILAGKNLGLISNINVAGSINITSPSNNPGLSIGGVVGYNTNLNYGTRGSQTGVVAYDPVKAYGVNDLALNGRVYKAIKASTGVSTDNTDYWRGTGDVDVSSLTNIVANVSITGSYISDVGGILGTQEKIPIKTGGYPYFYETSRIFETLTGLNSSGMINVANSRGNIGGIVGRQDSEFATIKDSVSSVAISTSVDDGSGIVGRSVENIGGLVGYSFGPIQSSHASGTLSLDVGVINVDLNFAGGLVGKIDNPSSRNPIIADSYSSGNINISELNSAVSAVGGLAGSSKIGSVSGSYSSGNITVNSYGETKYIGGLIGSIFQSNIYNSYSSNVLQIDNHTASNQLSTGGFGGLIGFSIDSNIFSSHSTGDISANSDTSCLNVGGVGGLAGNYGTNPGYIISKSYSSGNVTANCTSVGGLVGSLSGDVEEAFATGNVSGQNKAGGFVGNANGSNDTISNSFSTGNVISTGQASNVPLAGGFAGFARNIHITSSYSLGTVGGSGLNGGFAAAYDKRDADFTQSYYLKDSSYNGNLSDIGAELVDGETGSIANRNQNLDTKITALSKATLRREVSFENWNFTDIWGIEDKASFPYLKAFSSFASTSTTSPATNISAGSTTLNGNLTALNTFKPYLRGFLYGTNTGNLDVVSIDTGNDNWNGNFNTGVFALAATNLPAGAYSFRSFASSVGGVSLGEWQQFAITDATYNPPTINPVRAFTYKQKITISGEKSDKITAVLVKSLVASLNSNTWSLEIDLTVGQNTIAIVGKDQNDNSYPTEVTIIRRKSSDANNDGSVTSKDFSSLMSNWNKEESLNPADFNEDNKVDIQDFSILMSNWEI